MSKMSNLKRFANFIENNIYCDFTEGILLKNFKI